MTEQLTRTQPPANETSVLDLEALVRQSMKALEESQRALQEEAERKRTRQLATAEQIMRTWLGDLAVLLNQAETKETWATWDRNTLKAKSWHIRFPEDQRLAPITLTWTREAYDGSHILVTIGGESVKFPKPEHLLALARARYEAWKKEEERLRREEEKKRREEMRSKAWEKLRDQLADLKAKVEFEDAPIEDIKRQVKELWESLPEDLKQYPPIESLFNSCIYDLEREQERRIQERQKEVYARQLAQWFREKVLPMKAALEKEKERLERRPVTLYKVNYIYEVVFEGDEGHHFLETETFYTLSPQPCEDGFWTTIEGRRIRPMHVIMVEEIQTTVGKLPHFLPREGYLKFEWYAGRLTWPSNKGLYAQVSIVLLPTETDELERLRREYPKPSMPQPPFDLDRFSLEAEEVLGMAERLFTEQPG